MNRCLQCHSAINETLHARNLFKRRRKLCCKCETQWKEIPINKTNCCPTCLKTLATEETHCLDCQFLAQKFKLMNQLYCNYQYEGVMKEVMHNYKFLKDVALSELLAYKLKLPKQDYHYIIPIPSPIERDRMRTFNPVEMVLEHLGIRYQRLLSTQLRAKQSELDKLTRAQQPNPFHLINDSIDLEDKDILLIDDIYTTGLTIHHAACKLFVRKIRKLDVFTFAR